MYIKFSQSRDKKVIRLIDDKRVVLINNDEVSRLSLLKFLFDI